MLCNVLSNCGEEEWWTFPENDKSKDRITCHDLTRDFLIYGTDVRSVRVCVFIAAVVLMCVTITMQFFLFIGMTVLTSVLCCTFQ